MDEARRISAKFPPETDNDLWEHLKQFPKMKRAGKLKFYARLGLMIQKANEDADQLELLAITQEVISKLQRKTSPSPAPVARTSQPRRSTKPLQVAETKEAKSAMTTPVEPSPDEPEGEELFAGMSLAAATVESSEEYDPFAAFVGEADPEVVSAFLEYGESGPDENGAKQETDTKLEEK